MSKGKEEERNKPVGSARATESAMLFVPRNKNLTDE
jgi:hypothetical protein